MEVLNLNKFIPDPKIVQIGEKEYKLPGKLSVADSLKIIKLQQKIATVSPESLEMSDTMETFIETIIKLFQVEGKEAEGLKRILNFDMINEIVKCLYGVEDTTPGESNPVTETK